MTAVTIVAQSRLCVNVDGLSRYVHHLRYRATVFSSIIGKRYVATKESSGGEFVVLPSTSGADESKALTLSAIADDLRTEYKQKMALREKLQKLLNNRTRSPVPVSNENMKEVSHTLTPEEQHILDELKYEREIARLKRVAQFFRDTELRELASRYSRPLEPSLKNCFSVALVSQSTGSSVSEITDIIPEKWKRIAAMATARKQKSPENDRKVVAQYKKDLTLWNKHMISSGHGEIAQKFKKPWKSFLPATVKIPELPMHLQTDIDDVASVPALLMDKKRRKVQQMLALHKTKASAARRKAEFLLKKAAALEKCAQSMKIKLDKEDKLQLKMSDTEAKIKDLWWEVAYPKRKKCDPPKKSLLFSTIRK